MANKGTDVVVRVGVGFVAEVEVLDVVPAKSAQKTVVKVGFEVDNAVGLEAGQVLPVEKLYSIQHFTQGPSRYTDASIIKTLEELAQAWDELGRVACVLEKMLPLAHECSVIVARGRDGQIVHLPVQRNLHRDGILAVTEVYEGNLPLAQAQQALEAAKSVAEGLQYVGVLCVEFFVLQDGSLVVNEIAPRPHNSGHYSQNGCDVSQFELQVRCMTGLPLVQPRLHSASIMLNLLGDLWFTHGDTAQTPAWDQVLALPGCHLHLYGKAQAQRGRKMGHLNITATTAEAARATALQAAAIVGIEAF